MTKPTRAAAFLQALAVPPAPTLEPTPATSTDQSKAAPTVNKRAGLKHIGGYFEREDVEKFAILRARLELDNSELIKLAIDELYLKHQTKRAFGEA